MNNKAKLLIIKQVAQGVDGIAEYRIRQMCISGELPCFKAGKKYLINENVLLQTITANTLLNTDYPPLAFSIEKLLPQGIFILAGNSKIGKSWMALP